MTWATTPTQALENPENLLLFGGFSYIIIVYDFSMGSAAHDRIERSTFKESETFDRSKESDQAVWQSHRCG